MLFNAGGISCCSVFPRLLTTISAMVFVKASKLAQAFLLNLIFCISFLTPYAVPTMPLRIETGSITVQIRELACAVVAWKAKAEDRKEVKRYKCAATGVRMYILLAKCFDQPGAAPPKLQRVEHALTDILFYKCEQHSVMAWDLGQ